MQTQVKVTKNENGLLYNVVNLNFDDYYLMRDAVMSKIFQLENRIKLYSGSSDVFDQECLSETSHELKIYQNLLTKL